MYHRFIILFFLGCSVWTISEGSTPIRRCTDELPPPEYVQINDCEQYPCNITIGSTANITMKLTTALNVSRVHAEVVAYVDEDALPVEIPNDNADVCKHLVNNTQCPFNSGDEIIYRLTLPVDNSLPEMFTAVEFALVDENKNCVSCFVSDIHLIKQKRNGGKK